MREAGLCGDDHNHRPSDENPEIAAWPRIVFYDCGCKAAPLAYRIAFMGTDQQAKARPALVRSDSVFCEYGRSL